jgi:hypothetical protein
MAWRAHASLLESRGPVYETHRVVAVRIHVAEECRHGHGAVLHLSAQLGGGVFKRH